MTSPSPEQLLGFALGALDPAESEPLEAEVANNPQLQAQLREIQSLLQPLECYREVESAPAGLSQRTCALIFAETDTTERVVAPARHGAQATMSGGIDLDYVSSRWSLADFVVAAGIFAAAGMLFFPAIANSRYQAQLAQCQNNLRLIGKAFIDYSRHDPRQEFPTIPVRGPKAFAGFQAATLVDGGWLPSPEALICSGSALAEQRAGFRVPHPSEFESLEGPKLIALQHQTAGSMAMPLGYVDGDRCTTGVNQSRDLFAVASDAPTGLYPNFVSEHHDGKGQNVVFESGRVAYICGCGTETCGDPLFYNRDGKIEAARDPLDLVLASSGRPPFAWTSAAAEEDHD